ncbi:MAG: hypothetical protein ACRDS9_03060, partial [Pseudonocardiaceae bacterium]
SGAAGLGPSAVEPGGSADSTVSALWSPEKPFVRRTAGRAARCTRRLTADECVPRVIVRP